MSAPEGVEIRRSAIQSIVLRCEEDWDDTLTVRPVDEGRFNIGGVHVGPERLRTFAEALMEMAAVDVDGK